MVVFMSQSKLALSVNFSAPNISVFYLFTNDGPFVLILSMWKDIELYCKSNSDGKQLGDCPFAQFIQVWLTLTR